MTFSAKQRPLRWAPSLSRLLIVALAAIAVVALEAQAKDQFTTSVNTRKMVPKPGQDGFITISGGDNLAGWRGLPGYWSAKDGIIRGRQSKERSKQTFLVFSRFKLRDFELHLKYKFNLPTGNSGIQFRSRILDENSLRVGGYQADMDASGDVDGAIYDEAGVAGGRGTMSRRGERTTWDAKNISHTERFADSGALKKSINIGDWNRVVLIAKSHHIAYRINGRLMTELIDNSAAALFSGVLALQLHEGITMDVEFKDIKVRLLDEGKS